MNRVFGFGPSSDRLLRFYKLDENQKPVLCKSMFEFAQWYDKLENRKIAHDDIQDGLFVSTVFLGLPTVSNSFQDDGYDFMFETMALGNSELIEKICKSINYDRQDSSIFSKFLGGGDIQRRYRTVEEARAGHTEIVKVVKQALLDPRVN